MDEDYCTHCAEYRMSGGTCGCHRQLEDQSEVIDKLQEDLFKKQNIINEYESMVISLECFLDGKADHKIIKKWLKHNLKYVKQ
jgi:hypothetical protein